jgi:very-short-patch-repair endonuclease
MRHGIQRARALRARQTSAEARLWQALRDRRFENAKFRRQYPIDNFIVDFVCLDARLIVEVDGATHGEANDLARDHRRTARLESLGFSLLRVQNEDIRANLAGVLDAIWLDLHHRTDL